MSSFSSVLMLAAGEADEGTVAGCGKGVLDGVDDGGTGLPSVGTRLAEGGRAIFDGDKRVSSRSRPADSGNGIFVGERSGFLSCSPVSVCGETPFNGSRVHFQWRLLRFPRNSNLGRICR